MHFLGRYVDCQISAASSWFRQAKTGQEAMSEAEQQGGESL
jgi:hypothetical protein